MGDLFEMGERVNDTLPLFIIPLTGCREEVVDKRRLIDVFVFLALLLLLVKVLVFVDNLLFVVVGDDKLVDDDAVDSTGDRSLARCRSSSLRCSSAFSFSLASRSADCRTCF